MARQRAELETWKIKLSNASRNQHSNKKVEKAKLVVAWEWELEVGRKGGNAH